MKAFKTFKDFITEGSESLEDLLFEEKELKFDEFLNIGKIQFNK